ncbi:MAG TPA: hypothetical protein VJ997_01720 [Longimicrobiales bacterium]|nr:hypothetical protein [Longimicrobiales bacterium]
MDLRMLIPILGILLVMIPVAGVTMTLPIRYAFTPLVEKLARALRESGMGGASDADLRVADLEEQVQLLVSEVGRLSEGQAFNRKRIEGISRDSN